jgi:mannose-6-phosphate isomerase-like protein (cupin superfamily)
MASARMNLWQIVVLVTLGVIALVRTVGAQMASPAVTHIEAAAVAEAFARGGVLFDGDGGAHNYMVHASRRDGAGQAEVHVRDTDVIHVLDGAATFVTGGTLVDGRATAADEIRGSAIQAGETRRIAKGDVLIVPKGVPHWFQAVEAPITYFVVKVR